MAPLHWTRQKAEIPAFSLDLIDFAVLQMTVCIYMH